MNNKSVYVILIMIISFMGSFVVFNAVSNFNGFMTYLGFMRGGYGSLLSWIVALAVVIAYVVSASRISDVKFYLFRIDYLKTIAVIAAVCAGIVEEIVFRKWLMDYLESIGFSVILQIFASGIVFGFVHLIWGIKNLKAGINAALSTLALGVALGIVYHLGGRSLAPCVVAHFFMTALIEPGMIISAQKDKLGYWSEKSNEQSHTAEN